MRIEMKTSLMPMVYGFAIPVVGALFISIVARAPRAGSATELTAIEATSAAIAELTIDSGEGLDAKYLSSAAAGAAERQAWRLRNESAVEDVNPFIYPPTVKTVDSSNVESKVENPAPAPVAVPVFRLSAVMGGRQPVAVINGNLYKVGQSLSGGWKVKTIHSDGRSVVVSGPDGAEKVLTAE